MSSCWWRQINIILSSRSVHAFSAHNLVLVLVYNCSSPWWCTKTKKRMNSSLLYRTGDKWDYIRGNLTEKQNREMTSLELFTDNWSYGTISDISVYRIFQVFNFTNLAKQKYLWNRLYSFIFIIIFISKVFYFQFLS